MKVKNQQKYAARRLAIVKVSISLIGCQSDKDWISKVTVLNLQAEILNIFFMCDS